MNTFKIKIEKEENDKGVMLIAKKSRHDNVVVKDFTVSADELVTLWAMMNTFFMDALYNKHDLTRREILKISKAVLDVGTSEFKRGLKHREKEDKD